jgi:tetratricopeptide (TPR) repeat protein
MDPAAVAGAGAADLDASMAVLQAHLRTQPSDSYSWATLGHVYVEQARLTGDPSYYDKSERALRRSLSEQPADNDVAVGGQAALAAARHEFGAALWLAEEALRINPFQAGALAIRVDALTELGRYPEQLRALSIADRRQPGVPVLARLSYARELRGDLVGASDALEQALRQRVSPADRAFLLTQLAELDRRAGRLDAARRHLREAGHADPGYLPAVASRARLAVARGDLAAAERSWRTVTARLPIPEYLVELAELYLSTGRRTQARQQFAVVEAAQRLGDASGVVTDLELALFEADHGSPTGALRAAEAEWSRRRSIHAADALAWALHANGRSREALALAVQATRLGTPEARLWLHRGLVEAATGDSEGARRHLLRGLRTDPGVSPWLAGRARAELRRLGVRA